MSHRPLNRTVRTLESYIAYTPPQVDVTEDAERGLTVPYSERWPNEIYSWLSSGRSLVTWCQQPGKPARSLVIHWLGDHDERFNELREKFWLGWKNRGLALVDEAGDVIDEPLLMGPKGLMDPTSMADKKQRVETRLELAGLLDPARFRPAAKGGGVVVNNNTLNVTKETVGELSDEQLQRVILEFQKKTAAKARDVTTVPQLPEAP